MTTANKAKFTKGTWKRNYHANGCQYVSAKVGLNGSYSIASTHGPDDVANAHLIAAAPDMYKMLERFSKYFEEMCEGEVTDEINNLLAKARGE